MLMKMTGLENMIMKHNRNKGNAKSRRKLNKVQITGSGMKILITSIN